MRNKSLVLVPILVLLCVSLAYAQANGKLQIHFMDVGQGDGAVLISPQGEVVRPRKPIDRSRIAALRRSGASWRAIADKLGVSVGTVHAAAQPRSKIVAARALPSA